MSLLDSIREQRRQYRRSLVVLDDDPMSGQSLYDVPVLTTWNAIALATEMRQSDVFVLVTDTRSMMRDDALVRMREIGACLREASQRSRLEIDIALRGDSTLRGHFPADLDALLETLLPEGQPRPVCVFVPYFGEAGRVTLDDTQYVIEGEMLMPVAETQFARDPVFGYVDSHLPSWLIKGSKGRLRSNQIVSVSIDDLRIGAPESVATKLGSVVHGRYVVVNATDDSDLEVLADAMTRAEAQRRRFVSVSAAPFVRVRAGMPRRDLLTREEMLIEAPSGGGLTIVGSHIDRAREQLAFALSQEGVEGIEVDVEDAIYSAKNTSKERAIDVEQALSQGRDVVLHLGHGKPPSNADRAVAEGMRLSETLSGIVERLPTRPRYVMVKGGNTASHIARKGLGVRRATILGQLLSGVPAWRLGSEARWPELPFVIFAGNVGERESLYEAIEKLRRPFQTQHPI
jgi:uncharacterized protein YgbK (DUF1537 family)